MTRQRILVLLFVAASVATRAEAQRPDLDISVHGTILMNGFHNSGRVNNFDVPTVALPPELTVDPAGLGGAIRQTRFGVVVRHEAILGGKLFAELDADFFGGQQPSGGGRTHPLLRIRRAYGELRWANGSILVGQEAPPLFGVSPRSIGSVGFPLFASAGNLWLWLPQIRATGWLTGSRPFRIGIEGTLLAPNASVEADPFLVEPDRAELTGRPSLEGRLVARWRAGGADGEIGIGGHVGWIEGPDGDPLPSRAFGISAIAPLGRFLELRGELFRGRGLAGLGGGGIGQNFGAATNALLKTNGGWIQAVALPSNQLELTAGYGIDHPDASALVGATTGRLRNRSVSAGITWRPAPLVIGIEVRQLKTDHRLMEVVEARNTHLNLAVGIEF